MLATLATGLLLAARLLLPRAIEGQARKPGTVALRRHRSKVAHGAFLGPSSAIPPSRACSSNRRATR